MPKTKAEGLNLSRIAEQAITDALRGSQRERIRHEIDAEIAEHNRFLAENAAAVDAWRSYGLSEE